ncbi:MAG: PAS domain S-box protein [Gammaproteobacteria bacterium]|nr:PAS domain S-box protein [Gammaproteobacteria bacterium]
MHVARLHRFGASAIAGLVVLGLSLGLLMRDMVSGELRSLGIEQNESMARSLAAAMFHHIEPVLEAAESGLAGSSLRDDPRVTTLREYLVDPLGGMRVARIKIYSSNGLTIFSSDHHLVGESALSNDSYREALSGTTSSELVRQDEFNQSDGVLEERDLLESYVPLREPGSGRIVGVFELYTDLTALLLQIRRAQSTVLVSTLSLSAVLLTLLLYLYWRSESRLRREEHASERYLSALHEAHDTLEDRVKERTEALALSERRFQDIADAAGEFIWEVDTHGRFTFVSDRVRDVLGFEPEQLLGRTPLELAPAEDAERVREFMRKRGGGGPFKDLEHRSQTASGELIWLKVNGVPIRDLEGRDIGLRGASSDTTQSRLALDKLRKMSLAIEQSAELVIITDLHGVIEYVNPAFTSVTGYTAEEVIGNTPSVLRAAGQPQHRYTELWHTILAGEIWRGELCNRCKDGSTIWNLVSIFPLRNTQGEITHYVGLQTDITRRRTDEQALRTSESRLRALMDSVTDAIVTIDQRGVIEMANPAACELFGYAPTELLGRKVNMLMPQPYRSQHDHYLQRYMESSAAQVIGLRAREVEGLRKDGSVVPLELGIGVIRLEQQTGFVGVLRDLSERQRQARELEAARQNSFHREKMAAIGQLAAGIVHEVGNPAAAIFGAVRSLRGDLDGGGPGDPHAFVDSLDLIATQADRLVHMTREIADVARPRPVERSLLDLNQVVRSALNLVRYDARVQILRLEVKLDPGIPAVTGSADQLTQVILNLALNAAEAAVDCQRGKGLIEISTGPGTGDVLLIVRDNGVGMDPMTLQQARSPYFSTKRQGGGMGLGLSLCDDIISQHGGEMRIESKPGEGTVVTVHLPVDPVNWENL